MELIDRSVAWQATGIGVLIILGVLIEAVGIALIFPFVKLVADPSQVHELPWIRDMVGTVLPADEREAVIVLTVALLGVFIFKNAFLFVSQFVQAWYSTVNLQLLSQRLLSRYLHGPYAFHLQRNSADLINNILSACTGVFAHCFLGFVTLISELLLMVGIAGLLVVVEPFLTFMAVAVIATFAGTFYMLFRHRLTYWGERTLVVGKVLLKVLQEGFHSIKEAKILGREDFIVESYRKPRTEYSRLLIIKNMVANTPRLGVETLMVLGTLSVVLYILVSGGSSGKILATLSLFAVAAFRLIPSMNRILMAFTRIKDSKHAVELVHHDIQAEPGAAGPEVENDCSVFRFQDTIQIENISFAYDKGKGTALRNIDFSIRTGESIGLVGPSGAGKTTLVDIILGLLSPKPGRILVDGRDISTNPRAWQCQLGYVPQDIYMMDDTLRRNIAFGIADDEINEDMVLDAVRLAQLENVVRDLPDGLDTNLGEHGIRLSGGQLQRVGIARALYPNPAVLVLDEATSSLDGESEHEINKAIEHLSGTKTLIIIAHRLSTVRRCDRLVLLKDGAVADSGDFEELQRRNKDFNRLVKLSAL